MMKNSKANSLRIALIKTNVLELSGSEYESTCFYGSQFNLSVSQFPKPQKSKSVMCFLRLMPEIEPASTSSPGIR